MKIFSTAQVQQWDQYTIAHEPISSIELMERAARTCFVWLKENFASTQSYCIFCGPGNNGGDGLAIARMLFESKKNVTVYLLQTDQRSKDCVINLNKLIAAGVNPHIIQSETDFPAILPNAIIIDALFGSGLSRPLTDISAALIQRINQSNSIVISIDLPSGLFADKSSKNNSIIQARHTISFQTWKLAFLLAENAAFIGKVHIVDIRLHQKFCNEATTNFSTIDQKMIQSIYQPREQFSHKYNFGHALLYAGSKNMPGAAILCAKACLRSGAGLATIYVDEKAPSFIQVAVPEVISTAENNFETITKKKTAIGIGPGLEISDHNKLLLQNILSNWDGPLVIDASALQLLISFKELLTQPKKCQVILTPHTGEFEKLFGKTNDQFEQIELAVGQSKKLNCFIILKGHHTFITCPDGKGFFNTTGNSGMATAGSGDVLTGMLTGLLAQGYPAMQACILSVYLHGLAGDIAAEKNSEEALIASDIIENLGEAFKHVANSLH